MLKTKWIREARTTLDEQGAPCVLRNSLYVAVADARERFVRADHYEHIAIRRGEEIIVTLDPKAPLRAGDVLVMIGANESLTRIGHGNV